MNHRLEDAGVATLEEDLADTKGRRLEVARRELEMADRYLYQVINDEIDQAVQDVCEILVAASQNG